MKIVADNFHDWSAPLEAYITDLQRHHRLIDENTIPEASSGAGAIRWTELGGLRPIQARGFEEYRHFSALINVLLKTS